MRQSWKVYAVAAIVLVVSFVAAWTLPTTEILRGIIGLPGVAALLTAIYQIVRDRAAHERALELQGKQQLFDLGVTSHMAAVAFDKHVQFSEQYISRMQEGLTTLFALGPRKESLKICSDLMVNPQDVGRLQPRQRPRQRSANHFLGRIEGGGGRTEGQGASV